MESASKSDLESGWTECSESESEVDSLRAEVLLLIVDLLV